VITSFQIISLVEEYAGILKVRGKEVTVYKNPSSSDIQEIIKSDPFSRDQYIARFVIDPVKSCVFIWNAWLANHDDVFNGKLGYDYSSHNHGKYIYGIADILNSKLVLSGPDYRGLLMEYDQMIFNYKKALPFEQKAWKSYIDRLLSYNWSFADRYIPKVSQRVNDLRTYYSEIKK
jgi:hypothetical protein